MNAAQPIRVPYQRAPDTFGLWDQDRLREAMRAVPPAVAKPTLPGVGANPGTSALMKRSAALRRALDAILSDGLEHTTPEICRRLEISPNYASKFLRATPGIVKRRVDRDCYWRVP